nr:MAG TPA: hypothetical protein [Caudoviricetes sp.]
MHWSFFFLFHVSIYELIIRVLYNYMKLYFNLFN